MISTRMWDCDFHYNKLHLISDKNPYKEDTFEYILVNYILTNINNINTNSTYRDSEKILRILKEKKIEIYVDPWMYWKIFNYAIGLARTAGLVKIGTSIKSNRKKFGIYLEEGMLNLLKEPSYLNFLKTMKNEERRNSLWQVLYVNQLIKENLGVPELTLNKDNDHLSNEINFSLKNYNKSWFKNMNELAIPIGSWSFPHANDEWLRITSRGLFHHIGDQVGFMMAAMQYGDCYVVGKDEFGDLVILNNKKTEQGYEAFKRLSVFDFDYIYGVPKGDEFYPTKDAYLTMDEDDCLINTKQNAEYADNFWKNTVFKEMAGREFSLVSFSQILVKIKENTFKVLKKNKNKSAYKLIKNLYKGKFKDLIEITRLLKIVKSIHFDMDFVSKSDLSSEKEKRVEEIIDQIGSIDTEIIESLISCVLFNQSSYENAFIILKDINQFILNNELSITQMENLESYVLYKESLNKLMNAIDINLAGFLHTDIRTEKLKEELIKENSFFYKTTSHKAHCEIINPTNEKQLGFFLKNDGEAEQEKTYLNIVNLIQDLFFKLLDFNVALDFESTLDNYIYRILTKNLNSNTRDLYDYWRTIDNKAFVISDVMDMQNEYRMFIVNNKVAAASPCYRNSTPLDAWQNGRFDPRLCEGHSADVTILNQETRNRVAKYAKFAREFGRRMKVTHPQTKNYVLDVAWCDDINDVIPIEINSITWSGAYQINMNRVCAAIAGVPYHYEQNNNQKDYSHYILKEKMWEQMKKDKIINEDEIYSLNGIERTGLVSLIKNEDECFSMCDIEEDRIDLDFLDEKENEEKTYIEEDVIQKEMNNIIKKLDEATNNDNLE